MAKPDVIIAGTLQSGFVGIEEPTGFRLHNVTLVVDVEDVGEENVPEGVRANFFGHFETVEGTETDRWVFKAHRATRIDE